VGAVWAQTPLIFDMQTSAPVGTIVPYAGQGDPPETNWVCCDGRLISKATYPDFWNRVQHVYNSNGVDPGGGMVRIPDKRGRMSIGAINMGSAAGAGASDNNHAQFVRGNWTSNNPHGEVVHTLATTEGPVHNHWNNLSQTNLDHAHVTPVSVSSASGSSSSASTVTDPGHWHHYTEGGSGAGHSHGISGGGNFVSGPSTGGYGFAGGGLGAFGLAGATTTNGTGITIGDAYTPAAGGTTPGTGITVGTTTSTGVTVGLSVGDGNSGWSRSITGSYGGSTWYHGHTIPWDLGTTPSGGASAGSTQAHNTLPPYEVDNWIVRIA
jgi:hypothetical protein